MKVVKVKRMRRLIEVERVLNANPIFLELLEKVRKGMEREKRKKR